MSSTITIFSVVGVLGIAGGTHFLLGWYEDPQRG